MCQYRKNEQAGFLVQAFEGLVILRIEHGHGYSTVYAHNTQNLVHPGQTVKRGEVVAYSGSTGVTTGPHVHYEVWTNGKSVNPVPFLDGRIK